MQSAVAARYAKALVDVVTDPKAKLDSAQVLGQLRSVEAMISESVELRTALASPAVAPSKKRAVMARLIDPLNAPAQVRNFVFVVIDHRRIHEFAAILEAFEAFLDERLGYQRADVASAQELSEGQRAALEQQLTRLAGKKAKLRFTIDPSLVAGVVAKVGSTVYDGSVRGQLERLRLKLGSS